MGFARAFTDKSVSSDSSRDPVKRATSYIIRLARVKSRYCFYIIYTEFVRSIAYEITVFLVKSSEVWGISSFGVEPYFV
jgi:hypothetical protein